ncbi:MAG: BON domain-containing protein [Gemmatimonadaceae bacterium]
MARDFEDLHDIDDMDDGELRALIRERLEAHNALDIDDLTVRVEQGAVFLAGRVGTEGERLIAEHIVTDVVGIAGVQNDIVVDPIRRAESPEAVDEHLVDEDRRAGLLLGDRPTSLSPEVEESDPPIDADLYGTSDVHTAISDGTSWIPPESPTPEGTAEGS